MKKHLYKLLAGALIGTMLLGTTGCGTKEEITQQQGSQGEAIDHGRKGQYVEETLTVPEGIKSVIDYTFTSDSGMSILGMGEDGIGQYTSSDGITWNHQDLPWLEELGASGAMIGSVAYRNEEIVYVSYMDQNYQCHIAEIVENKIHKTITMDSKYVPHGQIIQMKLLENNQIMMAVPGLGALRMDWETGDILAEYAGYDANMTITQDKVMLIDFQRSGIVVYDLESGEEIQFISIEEDIFSSKVIADDNGDIYLVDSTGISKLDADDNSWTNILDASRCAFGMPSLYLRDIDIRNGEFIAAFGSENGYELMKYLYDENASTQATTQLTLYMFQDNRTVRQAIAEYQRQNPHVFIEIEIGMEAGGTMTATDAIRTLNTQLLAGKGPDLLLLDGLPVQSYIEKGVLLDMSDFAKEMIDSGKWMTNVLEAFVEEDGGIYSLPTKFTVSTMWGASELVDVITSIDGLAEWQKANPDKQVFYDMTPQGLITRFYSLTADTWLNEKGYIDETAFASFLESIKILGSDIAQDHPQLERASQEYLAHNDIQLHLEELQAFETLTTINSAMVQRGEGTFNLTLGPANGSFTPRGVMGINANSEQKDIAKEIIALALSKEVQGVNLWDGFSVHKEVLAEDAKIDDDNMVMAMGMMVEKPIDIVPITQEVNDQLLSMLYDVHTPAYEDTVLLNIILEETKGYFDGTKTVQEAAAGAANRTKAYLSE